MSYVVLAGPFYHRLLAGSSRFVYQEPDRSLVTSCEIWKSGQSSTEPHRLTILTVGQQMKAMRSVEPLGHHDPMGCSSICTTKIAHAGCGRPMYECSRNDVHCTRSVNSYPLLVINCKR
jgi:hypothetical protein